jgi:alpha-tubulin suppressor-like RCC1 family protein
MYQLGRTPRLSADTAIAPLSSDVRLSWVDGGAFHGCGLTPAGAAYCWGLPTFGNTGFPPLEPNPWWVPYPVPGGHAFTKLAFGIWHTCGITASGAAYCWGWNYYGQLGNGVIADDSVSTPVPVTGGHTFVDIAAGEYTTCALTAGGEIYCWGSNEHGSLGNLWMQDSPHPVRAGGGDTYRAIGMGYAGTCAIRTDGQIVCWDGYCGAGCSVAPSRLPHGVASRSSASSRDWQATPWGLLDEHVGAGRRAGTGDWFHAAGDHHRSVGEEAIFRGFALPTAMRAAGVPRRQ